MEAMQLKVEALEERIAPGGFGPSSNGNPGNEVSSGETPQPRESLVRSGCFVTPARVKQGKECAEAAGPSCTLFHFKSLKARSLSGR